MEASMTLPEADVLIFHPDQKIYGVGKVAEELCKNHPGISKDMALAKAIGMWKVKKKYTARAIEIQKRIDDEKHKIVVKNLVRTLESSGPNNPPIVDDDDMVVLLKKILNAINLQSEILKEMKKR